MPNKNPHNPTKVHGKIEWIVMRASFFPDTRKILISGILTFLVCFFLFLYIDRTAAFAVRALSPWFVKYFLWITVLGNSSSYLTVSSVVFLTLYSASRMKRWETLYRRFGNYAWVALFIFISVAASGLLTDALKIIFARYRPIMLYESGKYGFTFFKFSSARMLSFPSGHANTIFAFITALYLIKPRYRFAYFAIAVLVAASRVITGAHFPSDVIAGAYIGVVTTLYLRGIFLSRGIDIFGKRGQEKSDCDTPL